MDKTFLAGADNLDYALQLAALGWAVFPCKPDKTPAIKNAHPVGDPLRGACRGECGQPGHGYHDATHDLEKIYTWWAAYPNAVVGLACQPSGLIVFDLDRHPGEVDGVDAYELMAAEAGQPVTEVGPCQTTPGNGVHLVFKAPKASPGFEVPAKLAPGIDIRFKGYVCTGALPDGRAYQWQPGHDFDTTLTYPPRWIARALIAHNQARQAPTVARPAHAGQTSGRLSPADEYAARTSWAEILEPVGWHRSGAVGDTEYWTRPGKRAGVSATVNFSGKENLYVFTTNASPFEPGSISKFGAFALLHHNGDYKAAAADLKNRNGKK
jgi:hypothetical protein